MAAPRSEYHNNSYESVASPPPGQGHFPSYPDLRSQHNDQYDRGAQRPHNSRSQQQQHQQPYFDPPPREEYPPGRDGRDGREDYRPRPQDAYPPSVDDLHDRYPPYHQSDYGFPPDGYASPRAGGRGPPQNEHENQLTPYDEERAEAEWRRGVQDAYSYQGQPSSAEMGTQRQVYEDDLMREQQMDARERDRQRWLYDERERDREDRLRDREDREYERERRKRRDEEAMKEKALRYPSDPKKGGRDIFGASDGERGLAAKLAGGAGGAWIAHEKRAGALGTLGGIVVGALAGSILENQFEKRQEKKAYGSRDHVPYPAPGRNMDDVRRTGRDGGVTDARGRSARGYSAPRERSRSGFRDRLRRSLSRARSKSRPRSRSTRRRSESYDSEDTHRR